MPKRKAEEEVESQAGANKEQKQENKKLVLKDKIELMSELSNLAQRKLECADQEVKQSEVYRCIQDITELDASASGLSRDAIILLANIAATSSNLYILDFSNNKLGELGINLGKVLAKSFTLHTLNLSNNELLEYGLEVTKALLELPTLRTLYMRDNNIEFVDVDFDDDGSANPTYAANQELESRIKGIIDGHNGEVSLKEEMAKALNEMRVLEHNVIKIVSDYSSNGNFISSDLIGKIDDYDSVEE